LIVSFLFNSTEAGIALREIIGQEIRIAAEKLCEHSRIEELRRKLPVAGRRQSAYEIKGPCEKNGDSFIVRLTGESLDDRHEFYCQTSCPLLMCTPGIRDASVVGERVRCSFVRHTLVSLRRRRGSANLSVCWYVAAYSRKIFGSAP
jgi:hypothetical protein